MKTILLFFVSAFFYLVAHQAVAQFNKGDKLLNLGIGVNSYYNGGIPLSASLEVGISDVISLGGGLDFLTYNYNVSGVNYGFTAIYIGGRGSYHFNQLLELNVKELDVYGGASLGFRNFSWRDKNNVTGLSNNYGSGLFLGIHVGARYYFAPKVGVFLEVGAGGSGNARVGVAFKL